MDNQVTQNNNQPLVFSGNKAKPQQIMMGVILIVIGLITIGMTGMGGAPLGIGVLNIILACVINNDEYVTLGSDFIAVKAPIGSKKSILFSEINSIKNNKNKMITIFYNIHGDDQAKEKKVNISLHLTEDKEGLLTELNKVIGDKFTV